MGWPLSFSVIYELLLCLVVIFLFSFQKSCDFVPPSLLILLARSLMFSLCSFSILYYSLAWCFCFSLLLCWMRFFRFSLKSFLRAFIVSVSFPRHGLLVLIHVLPTVSSSMIFTDFPSGCSLFGRRFLTSLFLCLILSNLLRFLVFHRVTVVFSVVCGIFRARHIVLWSAPGGPHVDSTNLAIRAV